MPSAADGIRDAIAAAGGALRFDAFIDAALYGSNGFYVAGGRAGRRGDFITSPEVGPLFGVVLARALDQWWRQMGSPSDFTVVEMGAGPGTLARAVLSARPDCLTTGRYVAVETSDAQRASHPGGIESLASVDDITGPLTGVILANELLDNLPFRLFVYDGAWREAFVVDGGDGRLAEVLFDAAVIPAALPPTAAHGARAPIQEAAGELMCEARALLERGHLVVVDYCSPATGLLAQRPWREWLRTYRGHRRGEHYLREVGEQDITVEVAIDQLVAAVGEPDSVRTQAQFLQLFGIDELVDEGRRAWEAAAGRPDLAAMRMRSRVSEAAALLDPAGLGSFSVIEWRVDSSL